MPASRHALEHRAAAERADHGEAEQPQHEELGLGEGEHQRLHDRDRQAHEQPAQHAADRRAGEGGAERARGFAALRHRIAVEHGGLRRGARRHADQDRGDAVARGRDGVHAEQERERRDRIHAEGERQQDRHAGEAGEPGYGAEVDAERDAEKQVPDGRPLHGGSQTGTARSRASNEHSVPTIS